MKSTMTPYEEIIKLLKAKKIWFEQLDHEPVFTSEQAAAVRGLSLEQGAKSLLFKAGDDFVLVVAPGHKKVDWKKLKKYLSTKNSGNFSADKQVKQIRMATPDEVVQQMDVKIGACYPFGNIAGLRTLVDKTLAQQKIISCNPGRHDRSIKFKFTDYQKLVEPELADVT